MCTRTGGALAHVLEENGLATVQLSSVRGHTEQIKPPRALYCEFPFGRPLGKPNDAAFQRRVLTSAFALLERPAGPVLEDFPDAISDAADEPLACTLPPPANSDKPREIDEALG
ncbi:MAG: selenoprotein B, partial [Vulcanimicrobiaceae bacterium]